MSRSGTTKIPNLQENLGAVDVQLTPADLREFDAALARIKLRGEDGS
jgi:aryl-alcohol dehydrogenase-like predicted oxidoreductase